MSAGEFDLLIEGEYNAPSCYIESVDRKSRAR